MKELDLAHVDAMDCLAWKRKIVGTRSNPNHGILPRTCMPLKRVCACV